jgi:hypothetical protein
MNDLPEPEEVDSSLQSPSDNYDGDVPYSSSQTQLEQYAFTSGKPAPDLPLDIPIGDNNITEINNVLLSPQYESCSSSIARVCGEPTCDAKGGV